MTRTLTRRNFARLAGIAATVRAALPAADSPVRRIRIGHTGITWGNDSLQAVRDISALGFYGFETFGNVLEKWDADPELSEKIAASRLPLVSAYCTFNLTEPAKRKDEMDRMSRWAALTKKFGGSVAVVGPNGVPRASYDFKAHKADIVAALNDCSKMLTDAGLTAALHQHTGTCIETRDEVYAVLDAADTRHVKFGPDIGQLQKGGADPVKVVKDYLRLVRHMHLKDYDGGPNFLGYCPLGQGKVDIPAILNMVEAANMKGMIMVELDSSRNLPITAAETARIAQAYLTRQGYTFRT